MSNSQLLLIMLLGGFFVLTANYAGFLSACVATYVLTLGGLTTNIYMPAGVASHAGITTGLPAITAGDLLLVAAVVAIWGSRGRLKIAVPVVIFTAASLVMLLTHWGNNPAQWAGFKLYLTAIISFGIGRWLSDNLNEKTATVVALACFSALAGNLLYMLAQSRGIALPGSASRVSDFLAEGRLSGLYDHPGIAGKTVVLMLCFLLPLSTSPVRIINRLTPVAFAMSGTIILLTLSRANTFAFFTALAIWLLLSGRLNSRLKKLSVVALAAATLALNSDAISGLQARNAADPNGGYRNRFLETAYKQIASAPWTGTGPNYYIDVVGRYDSFAAAGFPVHNSFLFGVAELGIPLAVILFSPIIYTVAQAIRRAVITRPFDAQTSALFALLPGVTMIAWTGWGLMASVAIPLWYVGFGFLSSPSAFLSKNRQTIAVAAEAPRPMLPPAIKKAI